MSGPLQKWKKLTLRQRLMLIVAAILIVVVSVTYLDLPLKELPTTERIQDARTELVDDQKQLAALMERHQRRESSLRGLRDLAAPYVWRLGERTPTMEIQAELEKLASNAHVGINTRNPDTREISEHVRSVEIHLHLNGTMREITRFVGEVDRSQRRLFWTYCNLRRTKVRNDERIFLNGRVMALYLSSDAERLLHMRDDDGEAGQDPMLSGF